MHNRRANLPAAEFWVFVITGRHLPHSCWLNPTLTVPRRDSKRMSSVCWGKGLVPSVCFPEGPGAWYGLLFRASLVCDAPGIPSRQLTKVCANGPLQDQAWTHFSWCLFFAAWHFFLTDLSVAPAARGHLIFIMMSSKGRQRLQHIWCELDIFYENM